MAEEKKLIIGIDLSKDFIQASYFANDMQEPESVILGFASQTYYITTEAYKKKGENKWAFGNTGKQYCEEGTYVKVDNVMDKIVDGEPITIDDEQYMPLDILECLLRFTVRECTRVSDTDTISKIAICVDTFSKKYLNSIKMVLGRMSFKDEDILLLNRTECFVYYALSMSEELYQRGVGMFDFDETRLKYSYMNYATLEGKTIVMVDSTRERVTTKHPEEVDKELAQIAQKVMGNAGMSAIYLTGYGFEKYDRLDEFVRTACNRRRAFVGPNLYAKGAAIAAFEQFFGGNYNNRIVACEDRILADFDIEILEREKPKMYRAVRVGTNWYMAAKKLRFVVNDTKELKLHIKPIERKPDQDIVVSLEEFTERPDRMTKLMVEIDFSSATACRLAIKDMGFGDIYKTTGKTIYRDIKI